MLNLQHVILTFYYFLSILQPVFLSLRLSTHQGTIQCCSCSNSTAAHAYPPPSELLSSIPIQNTPLSTTTLYTSRRATERCLYAIAPFCSILFECLKLNTKHLHDSTTPTSPLLADNASHPTTPTQPNQPKTVTSDVDPIIDAVTPPPTPIRQTASGTEISTTDGTIDQDDDCQFRQHNKFNKHQFYPVINVIDAENEPVCLCSLYASTENELDRRPADPTGNGTICRVCRNTIKLQPTEHRKTLISKRLTLANDIIVNRVDTHYLNLNAYPNCIPDPYTPESVESHSPLPDDYKVENEQLNAVEMSADTVEREDSKVASTGSLNSRAVSPGQLKSRLEILQSTTLCKPIPRTDANEPEAQKSNKQNGCFERYCHIV